MRHMTAHGMLDCEETLAEIARTLLYGFIMVIEPPTSGIATTLPRSGGSTGRGGMHTRLPERLVDGTLKGLWVFGTDLDRHSRPGQSLAQCRSNLSPHPIQEHAEPQEP